MKVITIFARKGGSGKTTASSNIGYVLSSHGKRVLLLDFDGQGNLTRSNDISTAILSDYCTSTDLLYDNDVEFEHCIIKGEDYDLVGSGIDMDIKKIFTELDNLPNPTPTVLKEKLRQIENQYDYVIIDAAPSVDIVTMNAIIAANTMILPTNLESFSVDGVDLALKLVNIIKSKMNPELEIKYILPQIYDTRKAHRKLMLSQLREEYEDLVFDPVKEAIAVADSQFLGSCICKDSPSHSAARTYYRLVKGLLEDDSK